MADPSLIERLLQIRGTQFTPIENALVTEAASTLEDQARLIGECDLEAAYREGWQNGYASGDAGCRPSEQEVDWQGSNTQALLHNL